MILLGMCGGSQLKGTACITGVEDWNTQRGLATSYKSQAAKTLLTMATFVSALMGAPVAFAQVATTLEQAELAGLSPAKRAEVQARAVNGNTVDEVLQTVRLNSIKVRHPASRIVALDFLRGIAAVKTAGGRIEPNAIRYDHAGHNGLTSGPGDRTGGDLPMPRSAAPILRIVPGRAGSRRRVRLNRLFQPVKAGAVSGLFWGTLVGLFS
ncbi:MAG: hypothetical protein WB509_32075 [Acetobacteraceae bacterium]